MRYFSAMFLPLGAWDLRTAIQDGKIEEMTHYIHFFFESLTAAIKKSKSGNPNHPHTQFTGIVDWNGYSFAQLTNVKSK